MASVMARSRRWANLVMSARASMSPEATRRLYARDGAAEEGGVLVVLGDARAPFVCQGAVDTGSAAGGRGHHRCPPAVQSLHSPVERGM